MNNLVNLILLVMAISIAGLAFAAYLSKWVLKHKTGSEAMQKISAIHICYVTFIGSDYVLLSTDSVQK